jgi:hypothetical protein
MLSLFKKIVSNIANIANIASNVFFFLLLEHPRRDA